MKYFSTFQVSFRSLATERPLSFPACVPAFQLHCMSISYPDLPPALLAYFPLSLLSSISVRSHNNTSYLSVAPLILLRVVHIPPLSSKSSCQSSVSLASWQVNCLTCQHNFPSSLPLTCVLTSPTEPPAE